MKNKFEEFYFENDRNYPADAYWDLYDKNHQEAIKKYEGHMFCPLCRLAPLTVAKGELRRYFKVVQSDMETISIQVEQESIVKVFWILQRKIRK